MKLSLFLLLLCMAAPNLLAQAPGILTYQGRVTVNGTGFNGTGQFKFALVSTTGTTTYRSNDGTSSAGSQPTAAVALTVSNGVYSVLLGDTALTNMTTVPDSVFTNADVRLRFFSRQHWNISPVSSKTGHWPSLALGFERGNAYMSVGEAQRSHALETACGTTTIWASNTRCRSNN